MSATTVVIGVGNMLCGDDAAGRELVRRLRRRRLPPGTTALESAGELSSLIEAWRGARRVILVDAARGEDAPGTVRRFESDRPLPAVLSGGSSHSLGVTEALELARSLGELPPELVVYAIQGLSFELGAQLSREVERALDPLIEQVLEELA
jgi:hydrogenase maturation protease